MVKCAEFSVVGGKEHKNPTPTPLMAVVDVDGLEGSAVQCTRSLWW